MAERFEGSGEGGYRWSDRETKGGWREIKKSGRIQLQGTPGGWGGEGWGTKVEMLVNVTK